MIITVTNASGGTYRGKDAIVQGVQKTLRKHHVRDASVDIILLNDKELRKLNKTYLQHDYNTDVITFPLEEQPLQGEIYISLDTAKKQAVEFGVSTINELCRLAIHGTLHLLGHDDATDEQRTAMSKLENTILSRL